MLDIDVMGLAPPPIPAYTQNHMSAELTGDRQTFGHVRALIGVQYRKTSCTIAPSSFYANAAEVFLLAARIARITLGVYNNSASNTI